MTVLPGNIQALSFRQIENDYPTLDNLSADNAALSEVADQFEAIFIENLLKQARDSKLSDGLFDTNADDNFVEMFDRELANNSSKSVDIGIAKAIIQQMSQNKPGKI
jgi:flagellar protein FlgJ